MNNDDGQYLQWIACTDGTNTTTEYTNPTDFQFWVPDYGSISDAKVRFDVFGSGPDARIAVTCIDASGGTLATLVDDITIPATPGTPTSGNDPQIPVARTVWDVPPACFVAPRVTIRVTRLGSDCLGANFVRLAVASDFRREPVASSASAATCDAACVSALNVDDDAYVSAIGCSAPVDLQFAVADHASVTAATLDLDVFATGDDARMRISCLGPDGVLQTIEDTGTPFPRSKGLYSFAVPLGCLASPTLSVRIEKTGSDCLAADVVALDVKSFAHRVPITAATASDSCGAGGTACLDDWNTDDGHYAPIACGGAPADFTFIALDFVNVTRVALAMDVFALGPDARLQIGCVDSGGATLASILPATLFPQTPQTFGFDVPLACVVGPSITIRVSPVGADCLSADYMRLYATSPDAPYLAPNGDGIEGYTDRPSVAQGQSIGLKVHTTQPSFSIDVYRFGEQQILMASVSAVNGMSQPKPLNAYRVGAGWVTTYTLNIPPSWPSGIYSARLFDGASEGWVTFVVKEASPGSSTPLVLLASTNTWAGYDDWGGASFYSCAANSLSCICSADAPCGENMVSMERPNPHEAYPLGDVGHTVRGELHIVRWLENNGYRYSMLTDYDVHTNPSLLKSFGTAIISTHSEYWSSEMYDALEAFLNAGGNLLYLSGNGVYWKVTLANGRLEVHKDGSTHQQTGEKGGLWRNLGRPEAAVLGVRFTGYGYPYSGPFLIQTIDHWAFDGTGLAVGDKIGKVGLNLFEYVDVNNVVHDVPGGGASGWEMDFIDPQYSPANIVLLGRNVVYDAQNFPWQGGEITYYDHPGGGGVFAAGSINFGGGLVENDQLSMIISNALAHFHVYPADGSLRQIIPISAVPTAGSCTDACIPDMNHSDNQYLEWIACANGTNTSTEYTNPTDFLFSVPEPAFSLFGATLTLDTYGSGSDAVESVTCVDGFGTPLATIQPARSFAPEDPRTQQYPAFSQIYRWTVPSQCFTAGPTLDVRVTRTGSNCLSVDYLGLSIVARETSVAIAQIPTVGTCTVDCVSRLNRDDGDYVQWLACTNGGNSPTEYANPTDLLFSLPDPASVTAGVFVLDSYGSGDDALVGISCIDSGGATWEITPPTLFSPTASVKRYSVPMACLTAPTVTIRLTRYGSSCLAVDYARLQTTH